MHEDDRQLLAQLRDALNRVAGKMGDIEYALLAVSEGMREEREFAKDTALRVFGTGKAEPAVPHGEFSEELGHDNEI